MLLEVKNMTIHYGKALAVENVSLKINEASVVSIIGANGAGESTILKALSSLVPVIAGEILFMGNEITGIAPHTIVELGLGHIPEVFPYLTVLSNLKLDASLRNDKAGIKKDMDDVFEHFLIL